MEEVGGLILRWEGKVFREFRIRGVGVKPTLCTVKNIPMNQNAKTVNQIKLLLREKRMACLVNIIMKLLEKKIGDTQRGWNHTEESKIKIGKTISTRQKGRKHSEETKRKIGESHRGKIPWNKGLKKNARNDLSTLASQIL